MSTLNTDPLIFCVRSPHRKGCCSEVL